MRYIVPLYNDCQRCGLCHTRRNIVFGRGKLPADVLFIGEAPGRSEDMLGEAFVGASGRLLNKALEEAQTLATCIPLHPRYFIPNVCGCRPCDSQGGDNRQPTGEEAWACWPRLEQTYKDVSPRRVVLLGKVASQFCKKAWPEAAQLVHPAYVLRSGGVGCPTYRSFVRDLAEGIKW